MPKRIGNLLLETGLLDEEQLKSVLAHQRRFGGRIASISMTLGFASERKLATVLSRQIGVPYLILSESAFPLEPLDGIPHPIAQKLCALPVRRRQKELILALKDPKNIAVVDELRFTTGARIIEYGALDNTLTEAIEIAYRNRQNQSSKWFQGTDYVPTAEFGPEGYLAVVTGRSTDNPNSPPPTRPPPPEIGSTVDLEADWMRNVTNPTLPLSPVGRRTILVVEDDALLRKMFCEYLQKIGYDVWEAGDGNQAVQILRGKLPDGIVMDAMLPGIHGFDICRRIKSSESTRHIPVIIVSAVYRGWRYADDVRRLYGADQFLEKPLRLDELKHVLQQALGQTTSSANPQEISARARTSLQEAANAFRAGDLATSARHLEEAVATSPFCASLHYRLGLLYDQLNDPYHSIAELERAVELDPQYEALLALANLYEKTGFTHKAFEAWERCLRHCPRPEEIDRIRKHMNELLR